MLLSTLLDNIVAVDECLDDEISELSMDSRNVHKGHLFIAHSYMNNDMNAYIKEAIRKGATAVVCDQDQITVKQTAPVFPVKDLQAKIGLIAARFHGYSTDHMTIIGITGTNGKTSCSHFIATALNLCDYKCGVIGTLGSGFLPQLDPGMHTTPTPVQLQKELASLKAHGAKAVSMEVSSHGLAQDRVAGVNFNIAVFTNLTHDHLDYHKTLEEYAAAKEKLFQKPNLKAAVINADDGYGKKLLEKMSASVETYAYSLQGPIQKIPTVYAKSITFHADGFRAEVYSPWGSGILQSQLLGAFNVSNLLAALTVLGILNIPISKALLVLSKQHTICGRMQKFGGNGKPIVIVDYAHTPDALENVLKTLREHCEGKLWCVLGCGGDRDKLKRAPMGEIAERYSDELVITDDNPRYEDPQGIMDDIKRGLLCPWAAKIEHDRRLAIAYAISNAGVQDIVLIAGKGHETYQWVAARKLPFSDIAVVQQQLELY